MKVYVLYGIMIGVGLGTGLCLAGLKIRGLRRKLEYIWVNNEEMNREIERLKTKIKEELRSMWEGDDIK